MKFIKHRYWLLVLLSLLPSVVQAGSPPQITLNTPFNGDTVAGLTTVSGYAGDDIGLEAIEIRAGSGPWIPIVFTESQTEPGSNSGAYGFLACLNGYGSIYCSTASCWPN